MPNERLRATMAARGLSARALGELARVDTKTVERWINSERLPYAQTAYRAAEALKEDPLFLWPTLHQRRGVRTMSAEVVTVYSQRAEISPAEWRNFFLRATTNIDILVYAGTHLHESLPGFNSLLADKAQSGCSVRIALGDSESPQVIARGVEEKFGDGIESRCRLALMHYRALLEIDGIDVRTHRTTLYNSIYRVDDEALINSHMYAINAFGVPVLHIRHIPAGNMFTAYSESFDAVWATAQQVT